MKNYVPYKGELIAKNSEAYGLWEAKAWKKLDAWLSMLDRNAKDLMERYK